MKKRIIYGIGSTGSAIVGNIKGLNDNNFNNETIYRIWDVDKATKNIANIYDDEKQVFLVEDVRKALNDLRSDQHNHEEKFKKISNIFPIHNEQLINKIPITNGLGAAKNPIISRVVSQLNLNIIKKIINKDAIDIQHDDKEAFILLSSSGGTSTGLNVDIIANLLQNDITIYLFFISPSYFFRVDDTKNFKANTVASFLRVFYDLEKAKMQYVESKVDCKKIYPFIFESEYKSGGFYEYSNQTNERVDKEKLINYMSKAVQGFLQSHYSAQNFASTHVNNNEEIERNKSFFNVALLYPNSDFRKKILAKVKENFDNSSNKTGKEILHEILKNSINPNFTLEGVDAYLLRNPEIVKDKISDNFTSHKILEINKAIEFLKDSLHTNRSKWQTKKSNTTDEKSQNTSFADTLDEANKLTNKGFFSKFWQSLKDYWDGKNSENSEEEDSYSDDDVSFVATEIDSNKCETTHQWCEQKIENYKSNSDFLISNLDLMQSESENKDDDKYEVKLENAKVFENQNYIKEFAENIVKNNGSNEVKENKPPIIGNLQEPQINTYPVKIENSEYLLTIYSKIPDHGITYMRDSYLDAYLELKDNGVWCYPDKRLQGTELFDELSIDFHNWHDKTIKSLKKDNSGIDLTKINLNTKITTLSLISDKLNQADTSFKPIIDFKLNSSKDALYLAFDKNIFNGIGKPEENMLNGDEKTNIIEAVESFVEKLNIKEDALFSEDNKQAISLYEIVEKSKSQILAYANKNILKENMKSAHSVVEAFKDNFIVSVSGEENFEKEYDKFDEFFTSVLSYFKDLATLLSKEEKKAEKPHEPGFPKGIQ